MSWPGLGLSYEALSIINPALVMVSLSNFGQTGPYKNHALDEITGLRYGRHDARQRPPGPRAP